MATIWRSDEPPSRPIVCRQRERLDNRFFHRVEQMTNDTVSVPRAKTRTNRRISKHFNATRPFNVCHCFGNETKINTDSPFRSVWEAGM
ncbi:hypothetical protein NPIL_396601 [Nephila pilipes]|uniref:Uncharacterized protein n=1 Tax=Nephila pilipes TaxID=299642 RepID=A0A8X6N0E3_NEPPI|nr:hypothetical protein NPIL_396601 [Nephila pilipes]